ncbi:enzyme of heme biosynthesis [Persicobacter sp. CCB-QB2]|uniref:enzyme of heme biosynthesis n=1 Tax=Persicobacter sp. CCB-QB2 TaxID=1561025 RepID=UPI0006A9CF38|nr:enzyme of heme biosynthesis [Persicobacter sp. CCB-QB2]
MSFDRLAQLIAFKEEDPSDPFIWYSIALEYTKSDLQKAKNHFEHLLKNHKNYLPTYYHAAKLYIELELLEEAKSTYEEGIALAKNQGDDFALRELQNAYQNFLFEEYDEE